MVREIKGFTLSEIIIVIFIIGLLAAIAIPRFQTWKEKYSVKSETRTVYSLLEKYRNYAFTRKSDIEIEVNRNQIEVKDSSTNNTLEEIELKHPILNSSNSSSFSIKISRRGTFYPNTSIHIVSNVNTTPNCLTVTINSIRLGNWNGRNCVPQ